MEYITEAIALADEVTALEFDAARAGDLEAASAYLSEATHLWLVVEHGKSPADIRKAIRRASAVLGA